MSLKRIFNANHRRRYSRGFLAPSTAFINTECAKLTLGRSEQMPLPQDTGSALPDFLDIRVRLIPTYHPQSVTEILEKFNLRLIRQVSNTQICEKIDIRFDGEITRYESSGQVVRSREIALPQGTLVLDDGVLGGIQFILPSYEHIAQDIQRLKGTEKVAQTLFNLFPLGGVFDPHMNDIRHIQQRFLSVSTEGVGLGAKLSLLEDWHMQNIFPPATHIIHDQKVQFQVTQDESPLLTRIFAQDLYQGGIVVQLQVGMDIDNNSIYIPYYSMDVVLKTAGIMVIRFQRDDQVVL